MIKDSQIVIVRNLRQGSDQAIFVFLPIVIASFGASGCRHKSRGAKLKHFSRTMAWPPGDKEHLLPDVAMLSSSGESLSRNVNTLTENAGLLSGRINASLDNVGGLFIHVEALSDDVDALSGNVEPLSDHVGIPS